MIKYDRRETNTPAGNQRIRLVRPVLIQLQYMKEYYIDIRLQHKAPVFVYQMAKVGSSSIVKSLRDEGLYIHHIHRLNPDNITQPKSPRRTRILFDKLKDNRLPAKFIIPIRHPVKRNMSHFFSIIDSYAGDDWENMSINELTKIFLSKVDHDIPLQWFDKEVNQILGIDVYEYPFPESGYIELSNGYFDMLVIKSELPNVIKSKIIASFLGMNNFSIVSDNINNRYKYAEFKRTAMLPKWYVTKMMKSKYGEHFYGGKP